MRIKTSFFFFSFYQINKVKESKFVMMSNSKTTLTSLVPVVFLIKGQERRTERKRKKTIPYIFSIYFYTLKD